MKKLPIPKLPKLPMTLQISLGVVGAIGLLALGFFIVQRYMSVFSYLGMNPADVDRVKASFDSKCTPISYACRKGFWNENKEMCRGVYLCGGFPIYWHHDRDEIGADYSIYPILWNEMWSSRRDYTGWTGQTTVV